MDDKSKDLMFVVVARGEVTLFRGDGSIEVLYPIGAFFEMSTLTDSNTQEPLSWVFHFTPEDATQEVCCVR